MCFKNLLAGIWGSFLRFIETGFRNWLAACCEPALTQKGFLRLKPYWSFTITTHHFFSPACQLMRHMTKRNNFLLLVANCQRLAVSHRKNLVRRDSIPRLLGQRHTRLWHGGRLCWGLRWRRLQRRLVQQICPSPLRLLHSYVCPSGRRAGGRSGRGHGAGGCSGTGEAHDAVLRFY